MRDVVESGPILTKRWIWVVCYVLLAHISVEVFGTQRFGLDYTEHIANLHLTKEHLLLCSLCQPIKIAFASRTFSFLKLPFACDLFHHESAHHAQGPLENILVVYNRYIIYQGRHEKMP